MLAGPLSSEGDILATIQGTVHQTRRVTPASTTVVLRPGHHPARPTRCRWPSPSSRLASRLTRNGPPRRSPRARAPCSSTARTTPLVACYLPPSSRRSHRSFATSPRGTAARLHLLSDEAYRRIVFDGRRVRWSPRRAPTTSSLFLALDRRMPLQPPRAAPPRLVPALAEQGYEPDEPGRHVLRRGRSPDADDAAFVAQLAATGLFVLPGSTVRLPGWFRILADWEPRHHRGGGRPAGEARRAVGLVGARGFEPPTSASRTLRAAKLRHAPTGTCAPRRAFEYRPLQHRVPSAGRCKVRRRVVVPAATRPDPSCGSHVVRRGAARSDEMPANREQRKFIGTAHPIRSSSRPGPA